MRTAVRRSISLPSVDRRCVRRQPCPCAIRQLPAAASATTKSRCPAHARTNRSAKPARRSQAPSRTNRAARHERGEVAATISTAHGSSVASGSPAGTSSTRSSSPAARSSVRQPGAPSVLTGTVYGTSTGRASRSSPPAACPAAAAAERSGSRTAAPGDGQRRSNRAFSSRRAQHWNIGSKSIMQNIIRRRMRIALLPLLLSRCFPPAQRCAIRQRRRKHRQRRKITVGIAREAAHDGIFETGAPRQAGIGRAAPCLTRKQWWWKQRRQFRRHVGCRRHGARLAAAAPRGSSSRAARFPANSSSGSVSPNGATRTSGSMQGLSWTSTGRFSGRSGSGSFVRSDGCTGRWTASKQ